MRRNDTTDSSKRKHRSKLVLSKQTIRELKPVELEAGGGFRDDLEPELPASDEYRCC